MYVMTASIRSALTMNSLSCLYDSINAIGSDHEYPFYKYIIVNSLSRLCRHLRCFEYHTVSVSHHYAVIINAVGYDHEYPFYKCIIVNSLYSLYDCINAVGTMNSFSMYSSFHIASLVSMNNCYVD